MNSELVRSNGDNSPNLPATAADVWGSGQQTIPTVAAPEASPLRVVHRSLRGRYWLAVLLGLTGALIGSALGYLSQQQRFRAIGNISVSPLIPVPTGADRTMAMYREHMGTEAMVLMTSEVIDLANDTAAWREFAAGRNWDSRTSRRVLANGSVRAEFARDTTMLRVIYEAGNADVAVAGTKALMNGYLVRREREMGREDGRNDVNFINRQREEIRDRIERLEQENADIRLRNKVADLAPLIETQNRHLGDLQRVYQQADMLLKQMDQVLMGEQRIDLASIRTRPMEYNRLVAQLRREDTALNNLVMQYDNLKIEFDTSLAARGARHPEVVRLQGVLDGLARKIDRVVDLMVSADTGRIYIASQNAWMTVTAQDREWQIDQVALLRSQIDVANEALRPLLEDQTRVNKNQRDIERARTEFDQLDRNLEVLQYQRNMLLANAEPLYPAGAQVSEDRRSTMAAFGFVVGGGLPALAVFLWGLADRKYRYSDETVSDSGTTRGIALLGILPNLPDRLSDPSQASVAAHCVHQIRTMLQLNVIGEGPIVLAITSATSGDGKTSLTLALGLSFAAAGSRTLLVDTDIIGAGLSARMGVRESTGISDAIASRDPMQFVRDTDVADLSILPVSVAGNQQAGAFSPVAVRRLFSELRKHYDLILVDTGPVLGSIEATPLVAGAGATIFTVAKGQNRDVVEKAVQHLRTIGARIAGVVFNRAAARDFERSISGISLRSVGRAQSTPHQNTTWEPAGVGK